MSWKMLDRSIFSLPSTRSVLDTYLVELNKNLGAPDLRNFCCVQAHPTKQNQDQLHTIATDHEDLTMLANLDQVKRVDVHCC